MTSRFAPERGDDATVDLDLIWVAERFLEGEGYDVVYYFDEFAAFFAPLTKKRYPHRVVVFIHEAHLCDGSLLVRWIQSSSS